MSRLPSVVGASDQRHPVGVGGLIFDVTRSWLRRPGAPLRSAFCLVNAKSGLRNSAIRGDQPERRKGPTGNWPQPMLGPRLRPAGWTATEVQRTQEHFTQSPQRRMRDSNPRGREPNPLSKLPPPPFTRVLAVYKVRSSRLGLPGEERGQLRRELRRRRRLATGCDGVGLLFRARDSLLAG